MITLSEINDRLLEQNQPLKSAAEDLGMINASIVKMTGGIDALLNQFERDKLQDIEDERERKTEAKVSKPPLQGSDKSKTGGLFGGNFLESLKSGGLIGLGAGLVSALPGFLLKRGLPALLANAFADEIANYVEEATGSEALGDSVFRGLKLGSLGLLISKRLGLIGFAIGAVLTPENRAKFEELGINLEEIGTKLGQLFGVELPSMAAVSATISDTVGGAIDSITALTEGDLEGFSDDIGSLAATIAGLGLLLKPGGTFRLLFKKIPMLAASIAGLNVAAKGAIPKDTAVTAAPAAMGRADMIKEATKLSPKQLAAAGLERTAAGGIVQQGTTKIASNEMLKGALEKSSASKFPKLGKFLRAPGIGYLFAAYDLYSILSGPGDASSKVAPLAGVLASVLGSGGGALLGATLGSFVPGFGTAIGAGLGGIAGFLGAGAVGTGLAQYLMGQKVDAFGMGFGWINDLLNSGQAPKLPTTGAGSDQSFDEFGNIGASGSTSAPAKVSAAAPVTGPILNDMVDQRAQASSAPIVVYNDSSNKSVNTSTSGGAVVSAPLGYAGINQSDWNDYLKA